MEYRVAIKYGFGNYYYPAKGVSLETSETLLDPSLVIVNGAM